MQEKKDEERSTSKSSKNTSDSILDETKVRQIVEKARQNVKPLVKTEKEGSVVTQDLLNFRMKACR